jgi:hypothetical protein
LNICFFSLKEQPLYQPQTEAISPILDEPNMRDTTIIRNSISKLESDIEITMKKLHRAKLSQVNIFLIFLLISYFLI